MSKKVAILTGGGEVPGLNICLKRLVTQIIDDGFEPYGVRKGWEGLINYNPEHPASFEDHFVELTDTLVRPIDRSAGSFLHCNISVFNIFAMKSQGNILYPLSVFSVKLLQ